MLLQVSGRSELNFDKEIGLAVAGNTDVGRCRVEETETVAAEDVVAILDAATRVRWGACVRVPEVLGTTTTLVCPVTI